MTHFQVDAIEVEHAPVIWQRTAPPRFKLFRQGVIEPTDGASARRDSQEGLSHCSHGCRELVPLTNIWVKPIAHLLFRAAIAIKELLDKLVGG
jgi:hypothetical protein